MLVLRIDKPTSEVQFKGLRRSIEVVNEAVANSYPAWLKLALRPNCNNISNLEPASSQAPSLSILPT
ncbi:MULTISPECIES: hypothetical protein [unclassified Synechococcus]|uniref:hypothetical protein n=1 Tax=unclassified Synechococcus TaxID=2626047 RepID=UPI001C232F31|nr:MULTISPECIES: hypothetical protein [unclassified Synechococcus]